MNEEFLAQFRNHIIFPTWWQRINPLSKFVFCLCVGIGAMINSVWWYAATVFTFCFVTLISIHKLRNVIVPLIVLMGIPGIITTIVRVVSHLGDVGPVAFMLFGTPIPVTALQSAAAYFYMMGTFLIIMLTYFVGMEMRDICYCLENQLHVTSTFTFMTLSAMSSITSVIATLNTVTESQASRGIETQGKWTVRLKAIMPTLFPVIISSLTNVENKTLAMDARAFAVKGKHTSLRRIKPPVASDHIWSILGVAILIAIIVLKIMG